MAPFFYFLVLKLNNREIFALRIKIYYIRANYSPTRFEMKIIKPKKLQKNDVIGIISPASSTDDDLPF